jgi:hypothetical protein
MAPRFVQSQDPQFTVIWFEGGWTVIDGRYRRGAYDYQVDAVEAAFRLAQRAEREGSKARVLVQTRNGEIRPA